MRTRMNITYRACDVLVIGGGGAGVTAALTAQQHGAEVLLVCKDHAGYGNTRIIGGVMAYGDLDPSRKGEDFFATSLWEANTSTTKHYAASSHKKRPRLW